MYCVVVLVAIAVTIPSVAEGITCWEGDGKGEKVSECKTGTRNLNTILSDFGSFKRMGASMMGGEAKCCFYVPEDGIRGCWNEALCKAAEANGKIGQCSPSDNGKEMCVCNDKFLCNSSNYLSPHLLFIFMVLLAAVRIA